MEIKRATMEDFELLKTWDRHIAGEQLARSIERGWLYVAWEQGRFVGWLRYNLFWDEIPFLNMIFFLEGERGKGYGKRAMEHWEKEMRALGHERVLTSTQVDEYAQHFYQKIGYQVVGGFFPTPEDPYELLLRKEL